MTPNRKGRLLAVVLALPLATPGCEASRGGPGVAVEIEAVENNLDSCMGCGCRVRGDLKSEKKGEWWIAFGSARPDSELDWAAESASSRCGAGQFENVATEFSKKIGTPYVLLDIAVSAAVPPSGDADLGIKLGIRRLSGFDKNGRAVYQDSEQNRSLRLAEEGQMVLPVMLPDEREQEAFGVHEVLLRLRATVVGREAASYGAVSVSADVPGAEILLDGGFVSRIAEGRPTLLENVRTGSREIGVRDFSGRVASRRLVVKKGKTAEAVLDVLDLPVVEPGKELLPIGRNPQGYEEYWRPKDGAIVVRIPAGEFLRGSPEDEGEAHARPQRRLHISEFLIDKTEVTWRQFRKYADATGAAIPPPPLWGIPDDYPAAPIVWEEARAYCEWVGGRLPTEAEWEKAARGTEGRKFPWGDKWDHDRCNSRDGGPHRPLSVGSYRDCLSPYGVLEMAGSVWEWCSDWYGESYYAESPSEDPRGPAEGRHRVLRGGAWNIPRSWLRADYRYRVPPDYRSTHYGLRCVQGAPDS